MQQENVKTSKLSKMSLQSMGSNFSAVIRDLQGKQVNRESLRQSLKYMMSVESSEKRSQLFDKLISEQTQINKKSVHGSAIQAKANSGNSNIRSSLDGRSTHFFSSGIRTQNGQLPNSNISEEDVKKYDLNHVCLCIENNCQRNNCQCYSTDDQCLSHLCCPQCVIFKRAKLAAKERLQKQGITNLANYKPCTCKKTKCNKKYCACFSAGIKCTNQCLCDDCQNCDHYELESSATSKPKTYIDMEYDSQDMSDRMDFEPVQFPEL